MKRAKNYVVYNRTTGDTVSYHTTETLAIAKIKRIGYREHTFKRVN